jgi:hypothetical protein
MQFDVYPMISGAVLTQAGDGGLVQVNGDSELAQLWCTGKPVSGADCRKLFTSDNFLYLSIDLC